MGDVSIFSIEGTDINVKDATARRIVTKSYNGLCPQLPNESTTTKYLRQDGTWVAPPNTTYRVVSKTAKGLCPQLPNETSTTKYLRQDGTWVAPPNTTYSVVSKTANGLCPQLPNETSTTKYLRQDGTWVVPPNTTTGTTYNAGSVPANTTFATNGSVKNVYDASLKTAVVSTTSPNSSSGVVYLNYPSGYNKDTGVMYVKADDGNSFLINPSFIQVFLYSNNIVVSFNNVPSNYQNKSVYVQLVK